MNRIEKGIGKSFERKEKEACPNVSDGNFEVKLAMAKELIDMGLHPRSVERLLNIRLENVNMKKKAIQK